MFLREMITKDEVVSTILDTCPFYKETWEKYFAFYQEELLYVFVPDFVHNAIELERENKRQEILSIFEVIEKLLVEGDKDVKNIIEIGVLENFRHIFGKSFEKFSKYLRPNSLKCWKTIPRTSLDKLPYPKSTLYLD